MRQKGSSVELDAVGKREEECKGHAEVYKATKGLRSR